MKKSRTIRAADQFQSQGRVVRGSELSSNGFANIIKWYTPSVSGWEEYISQPIPYFSSHGVVYQVTGRDKVGKSHLLSIIAAAHTKKHDVIYVTTEFPAELINQKLVSLGADPSRVVYLDYSEDPHSILGVAKLGSGATPFHRTVFYKQFMDVYSTVSGDPVLVVVDSLTSFYEAAEWSGRLLAANLVRTIRHAPNVLAFAVSQKRTSHSEYNTEVAGGLTVSHIMDGTFILAKVRINVLSGRRIPEVMLGLLKTYGGVLNTFRWDGCRWSSHPSDEFLVKFGSDSVEIVENLTRLVGGLLLE